MESSRARIRFSGVNRLEGDALKEWIPIASGTDLVPRHVFHGHLPGQDLAIWRADDGFVNVWQNRCRHRGVRLTIGANDGAQLRCQYHGWCYANRTGACTYIPAQPGDPPAQTLGNRAFPSVEKYGLVWTTFDIEPSELTIPRLENEEILILRAVPVNAPMQIVCDRLRKGAQRFDRRASQSEPRAEAFSTGPMHVVVRNIADSPDTALTFFIQPAGSDQSVIRGVLSGDPGMNDPMPLWRFFSNALNQMRDDIETNSLTASDDHLRKAGVLSSPRASATSMIVDERLGGQYLTVRVSEKRPEAEGIVALELTPVKGLLPAVQPGAHIDVRFPGKHAAQYSLVNGPAETDRYILGVKLEEDGAGVSRYVHEELQQDDELTISVPRSKFPLRRDAVQTVLIAGGIGITPILSMAKALNHVKLNFAFHYFVRSQNHIAFASDIERLGSDAELHVGLSIEKTESQISKILDGYESGIRFYLCGPPPMLEMAKRVVREKDIPEKVLHTEYFENPNAIDLGGAFRVVLSRSNRTLDIPSGKSILQVLQESGVAAPSSCEQGACGTCVVKLLAGDPIHQDVYLSASERQEGKWIATCVSRSDSDELVLDL